MLKTKLSTAYPLKLWIVYSYQKVIHINVDILHGNILR